MCSLYCRSLFCILYGHHITFYFPQLLMFPYFFLKILFIYSWETHRERDRGTGKGRGRLHAGSPMRDLIPGPRIMPWAKGRSQTARATQGSPILMFTKSYSLSYYNVYKPLLLNLIQELSLKRSANSQFLTLSPKIAYPKRILQHCYV